MIDVPALVVRDGILAVAWLTAVYLVFMLLSLSQLARQSRLQSDMLSVLESPVSEYVHATKVPGIEQQPLRAQDARVAPTLRVSPRYGVAVSLAFQGFDVASIARRCDISVAEAKLVATLAQSYQGLEITVEEQHGRPPRARVAA